MHNSITRTASIIGIIAGVVVGQDRVVSAAMDSGPGATPIIPSVQQGKKGTRKPEARPVPLPAGEVAALRTKLDSENPDDILAGLTAIQQAGPRASVMAVRVEELIRRGSRFDVVEAALEALGAVGLPTSSVIIRAYTHHRDAGLRRAAVRALSRTGGPEAVAGLRQALSDSDPTVRSFSAAALGTLKAREASSDLFEALDRGIFDAAASIGQVCSLEQCERFAARLGRLPLSVYTSGMEPMLFRSGSEVPDEMKTRMIQRLRDVGTIEVHRYLRELLIRWPSDGSPRVREAIAAAISATVGAQR